MGMCAGYGTNARQMSAETMAGLFRETESPNTGKESLAESIGQVSATAVAFFLFGHNSRIYPQIDCSKARKMFAPKVSTDSRPSTNRVVE